MEEQKEFQLENNDLKKQLQEMTLKVTDVNNYQSWDSQQIVFWIISLDDGRFMKYEQLLLSSLKEEEINGSQLSQVNEADVKGWGINNFADKKKLVQHVKLLVNKNNHHNMDSDNNVALVSDMEGGISGGHFK